MLSRTTTVLEGMKASQALRRGKRDPRESSSSERARGSTNSTSPVTSVATAAADIIAQICMHVRADMCIRKVQFV